MAEKKAQLKEMVQYPTGLPNVSGYMKRIARLAERAPLVAYSAFYFNIKGFGKINKRIGQEKGDELLRLYGDHLKEFVRDDEVLGHLGGDNFMALIKRERQDDFIHYLTGMQLIMFAEGKRQIFRLSATIGIWQVAGEDVYPGEVISQAAIAFNQAKNIYHQNVNIISDAQLSAIDRNRSVLADYQHALEKEEFQVFYQPKVDSRTRRLVGAEGLVRWIRRGGMISPGIFIPPLEESGDILMLDYYVLQHTCDDIKRWSENGLEPVTVSVNFSRKDLHEKNLAENINAIIEESSIDKDLIEIEVTETVDDTEHGVLTAFINRLYELGIKTAIDDFGSGYSSLSTLREFQAHTLKIDRSFINSDDFSWRDEIILKNIIQMADALDIQVLTEGVEREDQLAFVNSVGCYVIQGFYYDKPLPVKEFEKRLKNKQYK